MRGCRACSECLCVRRSASPPVRLRVSAAGRARASKTSAGRTAYPHTAKRIKQCSMFQFYTYSYSYTYVYLFAFKEVSQTNTKSLPSHLADPACRARRRPTWPAERSGARRQAKSGRQSQRASLTSLQCLLARQLVTHSFSDLSAKQH